jgi:hypothetical protein
VPALAQVPELALGPVLEQEVEEPVLEEVEPVLELARRQSLAQGPELLRRGLLRQQLLCVSDTMRIRQRICSYAHQTSSWWIF